MIRKYSHFINESNQQYSEVELNKMLILYIIDEFNKRTRDLDGRDIDPEKDVEFFDDFSSNNGFIGVDILSERIYAGPINDFLKHQIQKTEEGLQAMKILQQIIDSILADFDIDFHMVIDTMSKQEAKIYFQNVATFLKNNQKLVNFLESKNAINKFKL